MTIRMLRSRARRIARYILARKLDWYGWEAREQSLFIMGAGAAFGWSETETARLADAVSNLMLSGEF